MPHVMIAHKKCTGCHMCELACSAWHEGAYRPSVARLFVDVDTTAATVRGHTCLQTACAKCEEACPQGAIKRRKITVTAVGLDPVEGEVLVVDEDLCTNCGICYDVCPQGVIHEHPDRHVAFKCDLCDGQPQCVAFCQNPRVLAVEVHLSKAEKAAAPA
ncbi:MAG: 4Fe-4S dicluster domain-containing protein [Thermoleophilia bacterium]|nr:4Fe-4S dicluster domain-containing protein [Thermoleophilia bacterium]